VRRISWALADQVVISGSTFAAAVVLARTESATSFGAYVLAVTTLLILAGLQSALITQPHNVLGVARDGADYARYTTATALSQVVFVGVTTLGALLAAALVEVLHPRFASIVLAVGAATVGWQLLEFARRVLYTEDRVRTAFLLDVAGWGGYLLALGVLERVDRLSPVSGVFIMMPTLGAAGVAGILCIRHSLVRAIDKSALRANLAFGKWLAGARVMYWASTYLYIYLSAAMLGAGSSAVSRVSQLLLGPLNVFLLALDALLPIGFARVLHRAGLDGLRQALRRALALTSGPVILYCALTAVFAEPLLRVCFGPRYSGYSEVVRLFALFYFLQYLLQVTASAYNARQMTRALFVVMAGGALTAVVLGWPLISVFEIEGAVGGMIIGDVVFLVLGTILWRRGEGSGPRAAAGEGEGGGLSFPSRGRTQTGIGEQRLRG
jgi:O-antigen/teichoic acid export membrane protein